ncbi:hypothetical protein TWF102_003557 [Orbilia oligospora]|uniref:Sec39 domain-containing protein n=1 Tax=Orbilia oligospora TaxID=2813651 RepID=A0A7C8NFB0_ORBOL|nr:hypothetical protein TWF102_003557 [Orbilia oligospora]KAF3116700.1 hypothetical protein TWF103_008458 [Orbilia oligospora]
MGGPTATAPAAATTTTTAAVSKDPTIGETVEEELSPSRALLLSLHFASQCDIAGLRRLIITHPAVFRRDVVLEVILRFVPESTSVGVYAGLVKEVIKEGVVLPDGGEEGGKEKIDGGFVKDVNEVSAKKTLEGVGFPGGGGGFEGGEGVLMEFVRERARAVDKETGDLRLVRELVDVFGDDDDGTVREWGFGILRVVERLIFMAAEREEGQSEGGGVIGIEEFEKLEGREGVNIILDRMVRDGDVSDGMGLLAGYVHYKKGGKRFWGYVYEWMTRQEFGVLWRVVKEWNGPVEDGEGYFKMLMARCYSSGGPSGGGDIVGWMLDVVYKIAGMVGAGLDHIGVEEVERFVEKYLNSTGAGGGREWDIGELVVPSAASLKLLEQLIVSVRMFGVFPLGLTVKEVMRMRFWGSKGDQLGLLKRGLSVNNGGRGRNDNWYNEVRGICEYLRATSRVFGRLEAGDVELEVLRDMLAAGKFAAVTATYVTPKGKTLLPSFIVEKAVIHAVGDFYDNATNGNRMRGGMKNASNALAILFPSHSNSVPLRRLSKLIEATHALSEYSLTLTPGVPLKPVQIRLFPEPVELISRVLQSNPKAYLQLNSLVKIAQDLVYGVSKPHHDEETEERNGGEMTKEEISAIKRRVVGMCVEAALAEDDFETAFSYVVNKLVPGYQNLRTSTTLSSSSSSSTTTTASAFTGNNSDTAWQAALQAGRYRSPTMLVESMEGVATAKGIEQVMKRMEVLSQALVICPGEAVMDVLRTWKNCEDELERLLELEIQEERQHAGKLGEWVGSTIDMSKRAATGGGLLKAPMSLLGAASSAGGRMVKGLGSTAFPLRSVSRQSEEGGSQRGSGEFDRGGGWTIGEDGERVRKRDVISGMVTSGLASGLGWMLGAKAEDINQQR